MNQATQMPEGDNSGPNHAATDAGFRDWLPAIVAAVIFGLVVVKLGNPVIFEQKIQKPGNFWELIFLSWPPAWGHGLICALCVVSLAVLVFGNQTVPAGAQRNFPRMRWMLFALPAAWLAWQGLSAVQTVQRDLTAAALPHFAACVVCFYIGFFVASRREALLNGMLAGLLAGLIWIMLMGFSQHFGGLEETRRQFEMLSPEMRGPLDTAEFRARLASNRIFSTFVYPNAFAGALLLVVPAVVGWLWTLRMRAALRVMAASSVVAAGLLCLWWSGSKAGAGIALALVALWISRLNLAHIWKLVLIGALVCGGAAAFSYKYSAYFERGATSASARLDYWRAALKMACQHPILGTGPGTFGAGYRVLKKPESEMARLAHNDYLEQASDSGWPGFAFYAGLIVAALWRGHLAARGGRLAFGVWLGAFGWALHGLFEFGLYIPALAWPGLFFMGWLAAGGVAGVASAFEAGRGSMKKVVS